MTKYISSSLSIVLVSVLFSGCGSSDSTDPQTPTTQIGTFVDAPVKGLRYITVTQDDFTDENGTFKYVAGENVEFKLGNLSLGTVTAGELITPYTLAGDTNISDPSDKAANIAMLLQSFDGNRSNTAMLDVSKLQDANLSDINISATVSDMTTKIADKFADNSFTQYRDATNNTPVDATTAKNAMKAYVGANSISVATGFGTEWLKGKTLWTVDGSGSEKEITTFTFNSNNTLTYGSPWNATVPYTVMSDGIIDTIEDNDNTGHEYYKIVAIDGTKISLCEGEYLNNVQSCTTAKQWLFTNQADAQAFYNNL